MRYHPELRLGDLDRKRPEHYQFDEPQSEDHLATDRLALEVKTDFEGYRLRMLVPIEALELGEPRLSEIGESSVSYLAVEVCAAVLKRSHLVGGSH